MLGRYYDPATAQFLSVDPLVDETGTPYAFTGGDPVNGSDPSGMFPGEGLWHKVLDVVAIPVYATYYLPYVTGRAINDVGCWAGSVGCVASHALVLATPIPELEVCGLSGDTGLDWIKNKTTGNGESVFDEDAPGHKSHIFGDTTPIIHGGPLWYLPGLYRDNRGNPHVDFEW